MSKRRRSVTIAAGHECYEDIFFRYYPRVRGFLARRLRPTDIDDVLAETFLVVWRRFEDLPPEGPPRTGWLLQTARLTMLNYLRSHQRHDALRTRLASTGRQRINQGDGVDLDNGGFEDEILEAAFTALGADDQLILSLVAWDQCSTDELAEILACSTGAARTRLSRARARFREQLEVVRS